jgi:hypothetical protein
VHAEAPMPGIPFVARCGHGRKGRIPTGRRRRRRWIQLPCAVMEWNGYVRLDLRANTKGTNGTARGLNRSIICAVGAEWVI